MRTSTEHDITRADFEAEGRACERSPLCQIIGDHDGPCDPRTENERARALTRHLDMLEGLTLDTWSALDLLMQTDARAHMIVRLAGGRS